jgi:hypothetical protein
MSLDLLPLFAARVPYWPRHQRVAKLVLAEIASARAQR